MEMLSRETYCVVVEDECVLILMKIVKTTLRDAILDLNGALDVLLIRQLHLPITIKLLCVGVLLRWRKSLHSHALVVLAHFKLRLFIALGSAGLLLER